jgi:hypothetical protein
VIFGKVKMIRKLQSGAWHSNPGFRSQVARVFLIRVGGPSLRDVENNWLLSWLLS